MRTRVLLWLAVSAGIFSVAAVAQQRSETTKFDLKKMKATLARLEAPIFFAAEQLEISTILKHLEVGGVKFIWDDGALPDEPFTMVEDQVPFGEVLQKVLDHCKWTYAVQPDGQILLRPAPKNPKTLAEKN